MEKSKSHIEKRKDSLSKKKKEKRLTKSNKAIKNDFIFNGLNLMVLHEQMHLQRSILSTYFKTVGR
jgi:hypothetical protein